MKISKAITYRDQVLMYYNEIKESMESMGKGMKSSGSKTMGKK